MNKHKNFSTSFAWRGQQSLVQCEFAELGTVSHPSFCLSERCQLPGETAAAKALQSSASSNCFSQEEWSALPSLGHALSPLAQRTPWEYWAQPLYLSWNGCPVDATFTRMKLWLLSGSPLWPNAYEEIVLFNNHIFKPLKCTFSYIQVLQTKQQSRTRSCTEYGVHGFEQLSSFLFHIKNSGYSI